MKRNQGNIITSDDVTMLGLNSGKTLQEVVENLLQDNKTLKSNVKWIYKYGGVGGSGGSSYSDKWSAIVNVDGISLQEGDLKTLIFDEPGTKNLYVHINNPEGDTFTIEYTYNNSSPKSVTLNLNNKWTTEVPILFSSNGQFVLSIIDGNGIEKRYNARCIVDAYNFTPAFVYGNDNEYNYQLIGNLKRYNIFIDDINEKGLKYVLKYNSQVDLQVTYSYSLFNSSAIILESANISDGDYQRELFKVDAVDNIGNIPESFASSYVFLSTLVINGVSHDYSLTADLLPDKLYLKILPKDSDVIIYPDSMNILELQEFRKYLIGNRTFIITPYEGRNPSFGQITCTYYINDVLSGEADYIEPSNSIEKTFIFNNEGWNKITLTASKNGVTKSFIYWIYTEYPESNIDWFKESPVENAYYRYGIGTKELTINGLNINHLSYIVKNVNQELTRVMWNKTFDVKRNGMVNIGIQYNEINNIDNEIIKVIGLNDVESSTLGIDIYLNRLTLNSTSVGGEHFYIEKETNYDQFNNNKYHLLSIVFRFIRSVSELTNKYEVSVYIDGVLLGNSTQHISGVPKLNKFILYNRNYSVNLLDISYFNNTILDADLVRYWWAYQNKILGNSQDIANKNTLLDIFSKVNFEKDSNDLFTGHLYLNNKDYLDELSKNIKIPVLCIEYNPTSNLDENNPTSNLDENNPIQFFDWSDHEYEANSHNSRKLTVGLSWANKSELKSVNTKSIEFNSGNNILLVDTKFTLDILGSTTRTYKSKNYTLGIEISKDPTNGVAVPIFTPNFNNENTNSFLPETSFTLKADIVDSSHTNNTCMGKFINANTAQFEDAQQVNGKYSLYIKNCLQGFPILLFVHSTEGSTSENYYYLGIYNFNLGRTSYFNLGYCDLNLLPDLSSSNDIKIYTVAGRSNELVKINNFIAAEIDGNEDWYDFSLYDQTMLFSIDDNDNQFMFDEIIPDVLNSRNVISKFVERTTRAGLFVFDKLEKGFHDDINKDYTSEKGYVPNAKVQYQRVWNGESYVPEAKEGTLSDYTGSDLLNYMYSQSDLGVSAYCNYQSLVEYYTICMTFGLLDSIQKNLNIKSWNNGNTFYFAFYDMDTCLGIDNDGYKVSYYSFSDFWEDNNETEYNNSTGQNDIIIKPVIVSRDYSTGETGTYDMPSSYAFAIAKYAKSIIKAYSLISLESSIEENSILTPLNLWANWRRENGPLRNANYFIDTYYNGYMDGVNELMFNYNFRSKYFVEDNQNGYKNTELKRFNGRSVGYVRNWINSRLHILDAYFNLNAVQNIAINDGANYDNYIMTNPDPNYSVVYETYPINTSQLSDDVYITKSIFGNSKSFSGNIELIVSAPNNSPLIVVGEKGKPNRYLLKESTKKYTLRINNVGTNKLIFGGSAAWTYLNDINSIANGTVLIESNKLTFLNGTKGNASSWGLTMPALTEVNLTSPQYSGDLVFDASSHEDFPNLSSINISGSGISLYVTKEKVTNINASNIHSASLTITGCSTLSQVLLTSALIGNCILLPISWILENGTFTLSNTNITNLLIEADKNQKLIIAGDLSLTTLNVTGFSLITISNCPKLTTIISSGTNLLSISILQCLKVLSATIDVSSCTNVTLKGCINLTNLSLLGDCSNIQTLNISNSSISYITYSSNTDSTMLDLTSLDDLNEFNIGGNTVVEYIKFKNELNNPVPIKYAFEGCSSLKRIYGNVKIFNTEKTFRNLRNFSILGNSTKWKGYDKKVGGVTQLPIKLVGGVLSNDNHSEILGKLDNVSISDMFDNSSSATNIVFNSSITGSFESFLLNTNIDLFDVYYIFNMLGLSQTNNTSITEGSFHGLNSMFGHNSGNSFDRYTFYKCTCITGFSGSAYNFNTDSTVLFSPQFDSNGDIIADNGLFSPLINLVTLARFSSGSTYFSRYLLRRKTGSYSSFKTLSYTNLTLEYDDIDSVLDLSSVSNLVPIKNKVGNMTDFFLNTPSILNITNTLNMTILNYDTLLFPSQIKDIHNAFKCTYGIGTFVWNNVFNQNLYSNLTTLANAFTISSTNSDLQATKVEFELYDTMFNKMPNLTNIGYYYSSDSQGGFTTNSSTAITFSTTFGFTGFKKTLKDGLFPYNIVSGLSKLVNFVGFFSLLEDLTCLITFPGTMFIHNALLLNIAGLFYNCKLSQITLTSNGFAQCPKLNNITRLFYNSVPDSSENIGSLKGMIPCLFLFTGYSQDTRILYVGTNSLEIKEYDEEYSISGEGIAPQLETLSVVIKNPNRSIIYATECFYGLHRLEHYSWDNTGWNPSLDNRFNNKDYIPFKYYKVDNVWVERDDTDSRYTLEYDMSSIYDGDPNNLMLNVYCKDSDLVSAANPTRKTNDIHYFCPPDLFYNFINNGQQSVLAMFKYCGKGTTGLPGYRTGDNYTLDFSGRICPYLFDNIDSVINLTSFFECFTGLSSYNVLVNGSSITYLIPPTLFNNTKRLNLLCKTFDGIYFDYAPNYQFMLSLTSPLDIRGLFAMAKYRSSYNITGVFNNLTLNNISGCFCRREVTLNTNTTGPRCSVNTDSGSISTLSNSCNFTDVFSLIKNANTLVGDNTYYTYYGCNGTIVESNSNVSNIMSRNNNIVSLN